MLSIQADEVVAIETSPSAVSGGAVWLPPCHSPLKAGFEPGRDARSSERRASTLGASCRKGEREVSKTGQGSRF